MEKETRINKYKELRDEMKEEVAIDRHVIVDVEEEGDDDFLAFLPKKEEKKHIDDTLMEPLSYETLKEDDEDVRMALKEAKVNVGKEQYNTRLDILSKIKQDDFNYSPRHEGQVKEVVPVKEEAPKKMTLLEKLAAMSPEEDAEELKKFEEGMTVADLMTQQKKEKKLNKESVPEKVQETISIEPREPVIASVIEEDEGESEKGSRLVTILNYVIIIFIIIFIVLAIFIVKQLFF